MNPSADYLAGVLDSDGSISVSKRHRKHCIENYSCLIQITWLHNKQTEDYFKFLVSRYGGSYFIGKSHSGFANPKTIVKYSAASKAAHRILLDVRNRLNLKSQQALNCIKLIELNLDRSDKPRSIIKSKKLENLYVKNMTLNGSKKRIVLNENYRK